MLARACKLTDYQSVLLPLIQDFIAKLLFEREVDLFSGEVDHRMQDTDVKEHIIAVFTPLIMAKKTTNRIANGTALRQDYHAGNLTRLQVQRNVRQLLQVEPCSILCPVIAALSRNLHLSVID